MNNNKYQVRINRLNFMGYETKQEKDLTIRDIKYMGEYKNNFLSFDYLGLPPSVNKLMTYS